VNFERMVMGVPYSDGTGEVPVTSRTGRDQILVQGSATV